MSLPVAICLFGPTATGKTAVAIELSKRYPVDIISVDSAMVYQGLDIGTAKPDAETLAAAPHQLIDLIDPGEAYSAGTFREDALAAMAESAAGGRVPLLVGGTMLYFRALISGLAKLPTASPEIRRELDAEALKIGWPAMHERLAAVDPVTASRLEPSDSQRIQRALEVWQLTGEPLSALHEQGAEPAPYRFVKLALWPEPRQQLHERIAERFRLMLEQGFEQEVRDLLAREDIDETAPAMRLVGYRQFIPYIRGECSLDEAVESAVTATRRLAKRQLTWLRSEPDVIRLDAFAPDVAARAERELEAAAALVQLPR